MPVYCWYSWLSMVYLPSCSVLHVMLYYTGWRCYRVHRCQYTVGIPHCLWYIYHHAVFYMWCCILQVGGVIEYTDGSILLVFLTVYGISTIMQCFLITVFFSKANLCACCASFIYFALYLPYLLARHWEHLMSLDQKLAIVSSLTIYLYSWILCQNQFTGNFGQVKIFLMSCFMN